MPKRTVVALATLLQAAFLPSAVLAQASPPDGAIPYKTVAAALAALKAKPGVIFDQQDGWTMAKDTDGANWSFAPSDHYAYPSVGRRSIEQDGGRFFVRTEILCQAQKPACDRLQADYRLLDQRMNEAIQRDLQKKR